MPECQSQLISKSPIYHNVVNNCSYTLRFILSTSKINNKSVKMLYFIFPLEYAKQPIAFTFELFKPVHFLHYYKCKYNSYVLLLNYFCKCLFGDLYTLLINHSNNVAVSTQKDCGKRLFSQEIWLNQRLHVLVIATCYYNS